MPLKSPSSFLNGSESLSWPILCKTDTHRVCMHNRVEWNINLSLQFYLTIYSIKTSFNALVVKARLQSHQILWCLLYIELLPTSVQLNLLTHFFISIKGRWCIVQATFVWFFFPLGGTSWRGDQVHINSCSGLSSKSNSQGLPGAT